MSNVIGKGAIVVFLTRTLRLSLVKNGYLSAFFHLGLRQIAILLLGGALGIGCIAGCQGRISPRPARPIVMDKAGQIVSQLEFPAVQDEIITPLELRGHLFQTDAVTVNGKHLGSFLIDTGAVGCVLDRRTAQALGLTSQQKIMPLWGSDTDGIFHIQCLNVNGLKLHNHYIAVADLSSLKDKTDPAPAGLVGGDVWGCAPFTLDYAAHQLRFYNPKTFRPPTGTKSYPLRLQSKGTMKVLDYGLANPCAGMPVVYARINKVRVSVTLDTGHEGPLVLTERIQKSHPDWVNASTKPIAKITGVASKGGLDGRMLRRANVERVEMLGATFRGYRSAMALISEGDELTEKGESSAIVGVEFLQYGYLTFDYARGLVWAEWRP